MAEKFIEIADGGQVWRFEREFFASNWTCIYGAGCKGILPDESDDLAQGCCSYGAHLGDGSDGRTEALNIAAYASMLTAEQWQFQHVFAEHGVSAIFSDEGRNHTRIVDDACVFLNRPGFPGGTGCALHIGAADASDSPIEWKPSVCWQLPIRVDWEEVDAETERATVRRWTRADWGEFGETMAWCCTERGEGAEAYSGDSTVVDELADELTELVGSEVFVELRSRIE